MKKPILSFYGDDFTGSTDAMESLATYGFKTVLFTRVPDAAEFAPFADSECIGIAGTSRSRSPQWMAQNLPTIFTWLKSLGASLCHYKVCSTFDSSPVIGSIGKAAEIGSEVFDQNVVPLIVGVPQLKRFTFAGHLFAAYQGVVYRIDRHPVMSKHPVTPMDEADLRVHLSRQTNLPVALFSEQLPEEGLALIDVFDPATQLQAGEKLLNLPSHARPFVIGSSGVGYAFVRAKQAKPDAVFPVLKKVDRLAVVSGSVSPMTERQIRHALTNGFEAIAVDPLSLAGENSEQTIAATVKQALTLLSQGKSMIAHTAMGHASDQGLTLNNIANGREKIGTGLGRIMRQLIEQAGLNRVVIAGGDTSSYALSQLDIYALTTRFPLKQTPGSPLCSAHSRVAMLQGLEIAMKGGQLGGEDYFATIRDGVVG